MYLFPEPYGGFGYSIYSAWQNGSSYQDADLNSQSSFIGFSFIADNDYSSIDNNVKYLNRYDLIRNLIETLKSNPGNRRMVLSLWQNEWLETAALPSCVWNSQWNLIDGRLNVLVTSRSSDVPLGLPFNVVQYAVLCNLIAQTIGARPGQFTFVTNDAHIYANQIDGIREQIARYDKAVKDGTLPKAPKLWINPEIKDFYKFDNSRELKDIRLEGYENLGRIVMPVTE